MIQPITPNHLVMGRNSSPIAPIKKSPGETSIFCLNKHLQEKWLLTIDIAMLLSLFLGGMV